MIQSLMEYKLQWEALPTGYPDDVFAVVVLTVFAGVLALRFVFGKNRPQKAMLATLAAMATGMWAFAVGAFVMKWLPAADQLSVGYLYMTGPIVLALAIAAFAMAGYLRAKSSGDAESEIYKCASSVAASVAALSVWAI